MSKTRKAKFQMTERRDEEARSFGPEGSDPGAEPPRAIDLSEPDALERWARYFQTSPEEVQNAIDTVGTNATAVEIYLGVPMIEHRLSAPSADGRSV